MRFGALTLPNVGWDELVERWRTLDELGIDSIWVADHLGNPYRSEDPWFEGWTCVAALASCTRRARFGPLVTPITLRNPAVLARAATTVDHASGGRLELAVGAGGSSFDHTLTEVEEWPPRERATRLRRFVERLRALLDDSSLLPRPVQERIPLTIGGQADGTLRLAAELADGWNTYGGTRLSAEEGLRRSRDRNERLTRFCVAAGRDPREVRRSALVGHSFVAEEPWRSEDAFVSFVERWRDAGFDELIVYYPPDFAMPPGSVAPGVFERAIRDVLPSLR